MPTLQLQVITPCNGAAATPTRAKRRGCNTNTGKNAYEVD
jgi:hypothetical protein